MLACRVKEQTQIVKSSLCTLTLHAKPRRAMQQSSQTLTKYMWYSL